VFRFCAVSFVFFLCLLETNATPSTGEGIAGRNVRGGSMKEEDGKTIIFNRYGPFFLLDKTKLKFWRKLC
jgi:hypothetical protein